MRWIVVSMAVHLLLIFFIAPYFSQDENKKHPPPLRYEFEAKVEKEPVEMSIRKKSPWRILCWPKNQFTPEKLC